MGLWHGRGRRQAGSEAFTRPAPRGYAPAVAGLIVGLALAFFALVVVVRSIRIVPQARAGIVERLGRYHRTLDPGLALLVPFADRVRPLIDLREQVVSFPPQPVITEDNLVLGIDTVVYFQVNDARAASYEIANYIQAIEQRGDHELLDRQLHPGDRAARGHHAAKRVRGNDARGDAHLARQDQRRA